MLAGWGGGGRGGGGGARVALNLLNAVKSEIGLPLLSRGGNPANDTGWWFTLPMDEPAWGREKRNVVPPPGAHPGRVRGLVRCLAAAPQCGGRGGCASKGRGSRALGQFVPVTCLHLDEGKLFLVLDAIWLCCRSGRAA